MNSLKVCVGATLIPSRSLMLPLGRQLWLEERFQGPCGYQLHRLAYLSQLEGQAVAQSFAWV